MLFLSKIRMFCYFVQIIILTTTEAYRMSLFKQQAEHLCRCQLLVFLTGFLSNIVIRVQAITCFCIPICISNIDRKVKREWKVELGYTRSVSLDHFYHFVSRQWCKSKSCTVSLHLPQTWFGPRIPPLYTVQNWRAVWNKSYRPDWHTDWGEAMIPPCW